MKQLSDVTLKFMLVTFPTIIRLCWQYLPGDHHSRFIWKFF